MQVCQNGACAVNNPHGICNDPEKEASVHLSHSWTSGCSFCEVNFAFILELSEKFKGWLSDVGRV